MQTKSGGAIPDDEIDVGVLGRRIMAIVSYPFALLIRNWMITLSFVAVAVLLAIGLKYTAPKVYKSSFIIRPNDRTEKFHLRILGDIEGLRKERNHMELARQLKVETNLVEKIVRIESKNASVKHPVDSINSTEVIISTLDPSIFLQLQDAILHHLESSPYFSKISDLQKRQISYELAATENDIAQLDSLKKLQLALYGRNPSVSAGAIFANELLQPAAIYTVSAERVNRRSNLLAREVFLNNFQLVKSCAMLTRHYWPPRILVSCLYMVPVFLLICFLFLHFRKKNWGSRTMV